MNDGRGNNVGSFEVKIRTDAAKFMNMRIARFRQRGYLIRERKVFIKDKTSIARRLGCFDRRVLKFGKLLFETDQETFGFR